MNNNAVSEWKCAFLTCSNRRSFNLNSVRPENVQQPSINYGLCEPSNCTLIAVDDFCSITSPNLGTEGIFRKFPLISGKVICLEKS